MTLWSHVNLARHNTKATSYLSYMLYILRQKGGLGIEKSWSHMKEIPTKIASNLRIKQAFFRYIISNVLNMIDFYDYAKS